LEDDVIVIARTLTAYGSVARSQIRTITHFRPNLIAWIVYSPLQLGTLYLLWSIVYARTPSLGGLSFTAMMQYYVVVHFLRKVIEPVQTVNYEVWSEINQGKLDIYLARPINFGLFTFARSLGVPFMELCIGIPLLLAFSLLMRLPLQSDPGVLAAFVLSVAGGYGILFLIQFAIGTLTFWMERIFGIRDVIFSIFMLFSGQLLPISLLPAWVQQASHLLPFQSIFYVPARIYASTHVNAEVASLLAQQAGWLIALSLGASLLWARGIHRYASQGG
jgi:ABC-2 type transport system permease protein